MPWNCKGIGGKLKKISIKRPCTVREIAQRNARNLTNNSSKSERNYRYHSHPKISPQKGPKRLSENRRGIKVNWQRTRKRKAKRLKQQKLWLKIQEYSGLV